MFARSPCSLNCTCQGRLTLDLEAQTRAGLSPFGAPVAELCGADLAELGAALEQVAETRAPLVIGCRHKEGFFREVLAASNIDLNPGFVDVHAGTFWSDAAPQTLGPKLAALHAQASVEPPPITTVAYESAGVTLILGTDDTALELARALYGRLDVTVMLRPGAQALPRLGDAFPVAQGRVQEARGWLGAFTVVLDDYATSELPPRGSYSFGAGRDGAVSRCDVLIDLTGQTPLFAADLRPGYLREDPARPGVVAGLAQKAIDMLGTFDKPRYVSLAPDLCAHSRNTLSGCQNCLNLCPTGAITSQGDTIAIDPMICAGCGECAAACPSGAILYQAPPRAHEAEVLRRLILGYRAAGGPARPVVVFAETSHGRALVEMSARLGRGLPAHVMVHDIPEIHSLGPDLMLAVAAWGADLVVLTPARPKHGLAGLEASLDLLRELLEPMGYGAASLARLIATDDPDVLEAALWAEGARPPRAASQMLAVGDKRQLMIAALTELNRLAPGPQTRVALKKGAPFGTVALNTEACTLCMACAGACPANALIDNPERPMLRFSESACLQCGICEATCPEDAISLIPQVDFTAWDQPRRVLHEEEPFCCTGCGTGFGTRSGIERVREKLAGHWMFSGARGGEGLAMLELCEDCRVKRAAEAGFDAHKN